MKTIFTNPENFDLQMITNVNLNPGIVAVWMDQDHNILYGHAEMLNELSFFGVYPKMLDVLNPETMGMFKHLLSFKHVESDVKAEIDKMVKLIEDKFKELNFYKLEYKFKTAQDQILLGCFAYSGSENYKFFIIENNKVRSLVITDFSRQRDGGTTNISLLDDDGKAHSFYSPSPFSNLKEKPTFNNEELFECTEDLKALKKLTGYNLI